MPVIFVFVLLNCHSSSIKNDLSDAELAIAVKHEKQAFVRGQEIWFDPQIGSNGLSCESCHPHGEMTNAETYPRYKHVLRTMSSLSMTHNFAVVNESKGKPWEIGSYDANSLVLYVKALANGKKIQMAWPKKFKKNWIEKGKAAFFNSGLGTNGKNCASCHAENNDEQNIIHKQMTRNLKGIAAFYPRYSFRRSEVSILEQEINYCIEKYLKGKPQIFDSETIIALLSYLTSLSEGRKIEVSKIE